MSSGAKLGLPEHLDVLLIEDSADDAELIAHELRRAGFDPRIRRVESAAEVRAALAAQTWDVTMSDHVLPEIDSAAVLEIIAHLAPEVPTIIVSGAIGEEAAVAAMRSGAADYVNKDDLDRLGSVIRRCLHEVEAEHARRVAERALAESEQRFRVSFENAPIGMAIVSAEPENEGRVLWVNRMACELAGRSKAELLGSDVTVSGLLGPEDSRSDRAAIRQLLDNEVEVYTTERHFARPDGSAVWVQLNVSLIRDQAGAPLSFLGQIVDLTERKESEVELQFLADHDVLTGLVNRRRFIDALSYHVQLTGRYGPGGAVLILDLDNFKEINDSLGHRAGDETIQAVSKELRDRLRSSDVLCRLGGDEFAVLLARATEDEAIKVGTNLVELLRGHPFFVGGRRLRVTASIGVAPFVPGDGSSADDLLASADLAMYQAKEAGRDQIALSSPVGEQEAVFTARLSWLDRIRSALESGGLMLHFQPIVDLQSGRISQWEALVRMEGDAGETIPPGAFLGAAERSGLVKELDRWVIRSAIELITELPQRNGNTRLEVNLSARSIGDPELPSAIEAAIDERGIDPGSLIFEVTETAAIANMTEAREFADKLTRLGCHFALDDFGAGFGSFHYLKYLPVDYLKIDGDFIRNLTSSEVDQVLVRGMVEVARGLHMRTIAEYVQGAETVELLREYGVDYAQGFHLGRPQPIGEWAHDEAEVTPHRTEAHDARGMGAMGNGSADRA